MTFGLVHGNYSLPEWQAVKLTFFALWVLIQTFTGLTCLIENFKFVNFLAILLCLSFTWRFPKISIFRCFRMFLLLATNKNALFQKRHRSLRSPDLVCFFDTGSKILKKIVSFSGRTFWVGYQYFRPL